MSAPVVSMAAEPFKLTYLQLQAKKDNLKQIYMHVVEMSRSYSSSCNAEPFGTALRCIRASPFLMRVRLDGSLPFDKKMLLFLCRRFPLLQLFTRTSNYKVSFTLTILHFGYIVKCSKHFVKDYLGGMHVR